MALSADERALLEYIRAHPGLTAPEIGARTGIPRETLDPRIVRLRRMRYLKTGPRRGRWRTWEATVRGAGRAAADGDQARLEGWA